jgi:hypothetical protein
MRLGLEVGDLAYGVGRFAGGVGEAAQHLAQGVHLAHGVQRAAVEPGRVAAAEVREGDLRVGRLLRLEQRGQRIDAGIGHLDHAEP